MIPYGRQDINQADINAVVNVLKSDFITQGLQVPLVEKTLYEYCDTNYAVVVNSATSALHIACLALGLGKDDYLWTSPITFVASANCALYCGSKVDFVDIDPKTYNLSPEALEDKLIQAEKQGKLPKIVMPVHFAGQSCSMKRIQQLSKKYKFKIIEDASHAIGGKYLGKRVGSCKYSDITVFSFHPVKIITTGEGGAAITNNQKLAEKMRLLRAHGVTRNRELMTAEPDGDWYYQQIDLGFNYRMTDIQAALGIGQMQRLDKFIAKRHKLCQMYDKSFDDLPIIKPHQDKDSYSALHLYPIQVDKNKTNKSRGQVFNKLRENGIGVNVHYIPIHIQPYYQQFEFKIGDFPNAESYYKQTISMPLFHMMTTEQHSKIINELRRALL